MSPTQPCRAGRCAGPHIAVVVLAILVSATLTGQGAASGGHWVPAALPLAEAVSGAALLSRLASTPLPGDSEVQVSQFIRTPSESVCMQSPDVLLATHLSPDRWPMLLSLADAWQGCLSVAVVLASTQQFNDTLAAFDLYPVRAAQAPPLVPPSTHAHAPAQTLTRWAALHIVVELGGGKDAHGGQALYPFNIARNAASMWPPSTALHTPTPPTPAMPAVESAASNASEEASPPRLALPSPAWLLLLDVDTLPLANAPAFSLALRHAQATAQTGPNPTTRGLTAFIPMTLQTKRRASEARLLKDLRRCVSAANAGLRLGSLPPCWLSSLPPGLASALDAHSPTAAHVHLNKTALATALQRELEPFHAQDYPAAYVGTVDTAAWWAADTCAPPTPARYTLDFEPYAAVPWPLPLPFDEAYRGHGFSKSDWWFQLCAGANCSLHVLPAPALLARRSLDTATHSAVRNRQQNWGLFAQRQRLARAAQGIHCQPAGPCTRVEPTAPPMPTPTAEPTPTPSPTQPNADAAPGTRRSAGMLRRLAALRERYKLRQAGSG